MALNLGAHWDTSVMMVIFKVCTYINEIQEDVCVPRVLTIILSKVCFVVVDVVVVFSYIAFSHCMTPDQEIMLCLVQCAHWIYLTQSVSPLT